MLKKMLSLCLCALLTLSALPALAFSPEEKEAAEALVMKEIQSMLNEAQDSYVQWMLAGAKITGEQEGKTSLTYTISVPDPQNALKKKQMADYSGQELLEKALANYVSGQAALELKLNLVPILEDGAYTAKWSQNNSPRKFLSKVAGAAGSALKSYQDKALDQAAEDLLFPAPWELAKKRPADFPDQRTEAYQAFLPIAAQAMEIPEEELDGKLCYYAATFAMKGMDLSQGLNSAQVRFAAADSQALLDRAGTAACERLLTLTGVPDMGRDEVEAVFKSCLAEAALDRAYAGDNPESSVTVSLEALMQKGAAGAEEILALYQKYLSQYADTLDLICHRAAEMPPYPRLDEPETGILSGGGSGTLVTLETSGKSVYVKFLDSGGKTAITAYIRAGDSLEIQLPQGDYSMRYARGEVWYGQEYLFGPKGVYGQGTVPVENAGFQHTVKLYTVEEGNLATYAVSLEDF